VTDSAGEVSGPSVLAPEEQQSAFGDGQTTEIEYLAAIDGTVACLEDAVVLLGYYLRHEDDLAVFEYRDQAEVDRSTKSVDDAAAFDACYMTHQSYVERVWQQQLLVSAQEPPHYREN